MQADQNVPMSKRSHWTLEIPSNLGKCQGAMVPAVVLPGEKQKQSFQPIFFIWYLSNEKTAFVDKSRVEPTIFFIEKISFSLKLFSGHFYGQSFVKTVRGPLHNNARVGLL